jgi:hypothetical protein
MVCTQLYAWLGCILCRLFGCQWHRTCLLALVPHLQQIEAVFVKNCSQLLLLHCCVQGVTDPWRHDAKPIYITCTLRGAGPMALMLGHEWQHIYTNVYILLVYILIVYILIVYIYIYIYITCIYIYIYCYMCPKVVTCCVVVGVLFHRSGNTSVVLACMLRSQYIQFEAVDSFIIHAACLSIIYKNYVSSSSLIACSKHLMRHISIQSLEPEMYIYARTSAAVLSHARN